MHQTDEDNGPITVRYRAVISCRRKDDYAPDKKDKDKLKGSHLRSRSAGQDANRKQEEQISNYRVNQSVHDCQGTT